MLIINDFDWRARDHLVDYTAHDVSLSYVNILTHYPPASGEHFDISNDPPCLFFFLLSFPSCFAFYHIALLLISVHTFFSHCYGIFSGVGVVARSYYFLYIITAFAMK